MKTLSKSLKYGFQTRNVPNWNLALVYNGGLTDFKADSEQQKFAYNEGLPGKAWAAAIRLC